MQLCSELPSNFIFNGEIDYTKLKSFVDILPGDSWIQTILAY